MRKLILSLCFLFAAIVLYAQQINGIRVESVDTPILVYVNGQQMCMPTQSCFIANMNPGYYNIEVYATQSSSSHRHPQKGRKLYNERFYYRGRGVEDIYVESRGGNHPGNNAHHKSVMNEEEFARFMKEFKGKPFKSGRMTMLDTAVLTADFTTQQCMQLIEVYTFDNDRMEIMKKLYPQIMDKQYFYTVIEKLTFSINKDKMNAYIKQFHNNDTPHH